MLPRPDSQKLHRFQDDTARQVRRFERFSPL